MLMTILTFLTFMGQIIANIFAGEWTVILVLNFIVFLGLLALFVGLCIGIWQGQNGITRGLAVVAASFLHERAYLLVVQSYIIQGKDVLSLGEWRLATVIIILIAGAYSIYEVIRHVIQSAHSGDEVN